MWFRFFLAGWSLLFIVFFLWLASHQSVEGAYLGRYSRTFFVLLFSVGSLVFLSALSQLTCIYKHLYPLRIEILLFIVSTGLSVGAAESIIRILDPLEFSYFEEISRYRSDLLADSSRISKHRPRFEETYQKVKVRTNEYGFRDRPLGKKEKDELRFLLLGDSVAFGWGVRAEDTFSRKLEPLLREKFQRPVKTVNTSVVGYNTVQEYATLTSFAEVVDPDMVFLLYVRNDVEIYPPFNPGAEKELNELSGKSPPEIIFHILKKSWIFGLGYWASNHGGGSKHFKIFSPEGASLSIIDSRGTKESLDSLVKIAKFCQGRKIPFIAFYYRTKQELSIQSTISEQLFQEILKIGNTHQFPVIDVEPWWGSRKMRSLTNSVIDSHPNKLGHELLAIGMAEFLEEYGNGLKMPN